MFNLIVGVFGVLLGGLMLAPLLDEAALHLAGLSLSGLMLLLSGIVIVQETVELYERRVARPRRKPAMRRFAVREKPLPMPRGRATTSEPQNRA